MTIPHADSPPTPLLHLAQQLKQTVTIPVVAIGKIDRAELAEALLTEDKADFVAMARALIADPELPNKAEVGKTDLIRHCVHCMEDCLQKGAKGIGRCCIVNPFAGSEWRWQVHAAEQQKKVLIIGGGPGGIQAAIIASQRGHDTELWEASNVLGGQAKFAHVAPFKEEMAEALGYLIQSLERCEVKIKLNRFGSVKSIIKHNPDCLLLATGLVPKSLPIPGIEKEMVINGRKLYASQPNVGRQIVILGGGDIGCETADWLSAPGINVSIVEMLPDVLNRMKTIPKQRLLARLSEKEVKIYTNTTPLFIADDHVKVRQEGDNFEIAADTVILATNADPNRALLDELEETDARFQIEVVGDAISPGNIGTALRSATEVTLRI